MFDLDFKDYLLIHILLKIELNRLQNKLLENRNLNSNSDFIKSINSDLDDVTNLLCKVEGIRHSEKSN